MVLNFIKSSGFDSFGEFLTVVFSTPGPDDPLPPVLSSHTAAFFGKQGRLGTHPIDVIRLMYEYPRSEKYTTTGAPQPRVLPSLPRHARPRHERLRPTIPAVDQADMSTRADIADWALSHVVLPAIDKELKTLCARPRLTQALRAQMGRSSEPERSEGGEYRGDPGIPSLQRNDVNTC